MIRRRALILSEAGYAPVPFWLGLKLKDLGRWIGTHNRLFDERKKIRDEARRKARRK